MFFRLGLLGRDISYSLSPRIHEWGLQTVGLRGSYRLWDVPASDVEKVIRGSDWDGLNVTVPYKTHAAELCDELTTVAERIGAVNVIWRIGDRVIGDNCDGEGFLFALRRVAEDDFDPRATLIVGSGGAARAIMYALKRVYASIEIEIASRSPISADSISLPDASRRLKNYDLIVQATPVGGQHVPGVPLPEPLEFSSESAVIDLIYSPRKTEFLLAAERSGARIQNGLPMLLSQAAASLKIWTGRTFPLDRAMTVLLPELERE